MPPCEFEQTAIRRHGKDEEERLNGRTDKQTNERRASERANKQTAQTEQKYHPKGAKTDTHNANDCLGTLRSVFAVSRVPLRRTTDAGTADRSVDAQLISL